MKNLLPRPIQRRHLLREVESALSTRAARRLLNHRRAVVFRSTTGLYLLVALEDSGEKLLMEVADRPLPADLVHRMAPDAEVPAKPIINTTLFASATLGMAVAVVKPSLLSPLLPIGLVLGTGAVVSAAYLLSAYRRAQKAARPHDARSTAAWTLTSWSSRLAGRRRDTSHWEAHLAGAPEDGVTLTRQQQRSAAAGFLIAAIRLRTHDLFYRLWRPVDWMLTSQRRRETAVATPPALLTIYIAERDGLHTLLTEGWGWITGCGIATFAVTRWLQRLRGMETADSSAPNRD
ncbi:hypothetical protein [Streptomyces sp. NPDC093970]|uniref:hypothetical protein n=1 Tax=Streptomyces sp. NPDC093970 TaxID=3155076 RepID=UPI0034221B1C